MFEGCAVCINLAITLGGRPHSNTKCEMGVMGSCLGEKRLPCPDLQDVDTHLCPQGRLSAQCDKHGRYSDSDPDAPYTFWALCRGGGRGGGASGGSQVTQRTYLKMIPLSR